MPTKTKRKRTAFAALAKPNEVTVRRADEFDAMDDKQLIDAAIEVSGLDRDTFAAVIAWRAPRSIRRWHAKQHTIPETARDRLLWFMRLPKRMRFDYVTLARYNIDRP